MTKITRAMLTALLLTSTSGAAIAQIIPPSPGPLPVPDAKAIAKRWGTLATLAGTTWLDGKDQVVDYRWDQPGQLLIMTVRGLYGNSQTLISNGADPKLLKTYTREADGRSVEGTFHAGSSDYTFERGGRLTQCMISKRAIACATAWKDGKRWTGERRIILSPGDAAGAKALFAALPGTFPDRAPGSFAPQLGGLAAISGKTMAGDAGQLSITAAIEASVASVSVGEFDNQEMAVDGRYYTEAGTPGHISGSYEVVNSKGRYDTYPLGYAVTPDGAVSTARRDGTWVTYRVSGDGKAVLAIVTAGQGKKVKELSRAVYYERFNALADLPKWRALGDVVGRTYQNIGYPVADGFRRYVALNGDTMAAFTYYLRRGQYRLAKVCTIKAPRGNQAEQHCQDDNTTSEAPITNLDKTGWNVATTRYAVTSNAVTTIYAPSNPGGTPSTSMFALTTMPKFATDAFAARREVERRDERRAYIAREHEKEENQRAFYNALQGLARSVGADTNNPTAMLQPTDWGARLRANAGAGSGMPATMPGGYASTMGGITYVKPAPASQEYLLREAELERYRIRQELYSEAQGGYSAAERTKIAQDSTNAKARIEAEGAARQRQTAAAAAERDASDAAAERDRDVAAKQYDEKNAADRTARAAATKQEQQQRAEQQAAANAKAAAMGRARTQSAKAAITVTDGRDAPSGMSAEESVRQADAFAANEARKREDAAIAASMKAENDASAEKNRREREEYLKTRCGKMAASTAAGKPGTAVCG